MSSLVKLFGLSNRVFNRLLYFKYLYSSQIATISLNERLFSTNVVNIKNKFTKISDELITERKELSDEKDQKRGGRGEARRQKEDSLFEKQDGKLIEKLRVLEINVSKWGRLDIKNVQQVISSIKDELSSDECSMLLRCCGSFLILSTPAERQLITDQVWDLIKLKGIDLNIQVFNSLMFTYLENGHSFSPLSILNHIENTYNIIPSKTTFELLIAGFCEQGDILGARKIMEHMKTLDLPLSHFVIHYLIRAHVKNNDIEGAKNLIKSMSNHGLMVTPETNRMYLISLAEMGNMLTFEEELNQMRSASLQLNSKSIFDIAIASSKHQHYNNTTKILKSLKFCSEQSKSNDILNNSLQLLVMGDFVNGLELLNEMDQVSKYKFSARALKSYIYNEKPVEKLFELYDVLKKNDLTDVNHSLLIHWSTYGNLEYQYSLKIIKYLKSKNEEIRVLHYIPLLNQSLLSNNLERIYAITQQICLNCKSKNDPILGTLIFKILPTLQNQFDQTIDDIILQFRKYDLKLAVLDCLRVSSYLQKADFKSATSLVVDGCKFSRNIINRQIPDAYFINKETSEMIELILAMKTKMDVVASVEFVSTLLLNLFNHPKTDANLAGEFIHAFNQANFKISVDFVEKLKEALNTLNVSQQYLEIILSMNKYEHTINSNKSLENNRTELKERLQLKRKIASIENELITSAKNGEVSKVESLIKSLNEKDLIFSPQIFRLLGVMYAKFNRDKNTALNYLNKLCSHHPDMLKYSLLLLEICTLQLVDGQHKEAMELYSKHSKRIKDQLIEDGFSENNKNLNACLRLLKASSGKNPYGHSSLQVPVETSSDNKKIQLDVWKTYDWMETLFNDGFVKKGNYDLLNFTTNLFLQNNDLDALLACYERCVLRFGFAPSFNKVLAKISLNDPDKLNNAIELTCKVFDQNEVQTKMFFIYVSQKKINEATKILQMPNFKLEYELIFKEFNNLIRNNKEDDLLLIQEVSNGSSMHTEAILQLINFYGKKNDVEKVKWAYSLFEKYELTPSKKKLACISSLYSSLQIPMPQLLQHHLIIDDGQINSINKEDGSFEEIATPINNKIDPNMKKGKIRKSRVPVNTSIEASSNSHITGEIQDLSIKPISLVNKKDKKYQDKNSNLEENFKKLMNEYTSEKGVKAFGDNVDLGVDKISGLVSNVVSEVLRLDTENKKKEALNLLYSTAKQLLNNRDYKDLRSLIYEISDSNKLYMMIELRKLKINNKFSERFFNKRLFITYINNEKGSEILDYLTLNVDKLQNFVSLDVLTQLHLKSQTTVFSKLEELILKDGDTLSNYGLVHLYNFYVQQHLNQKAEVLLQDNSLFKKRMEIRQMRTNNSSSRQPHNNDDKDKRRTL